MSALRNPEAEAYVIGSLLLDANTLADVRDLVSVDDFAVELHRNAFAAIDRLVAQGQSADELAVATAAGVPAAKLIELSEAVPSTASVRSYALQVSISARLRRLSAVCGTITAEAREAQITGEDDAAAFFAEAQQRVIDATVFGRSRHKSMPDTMREVFRNADERSKTRGQLPGVTTGFPRLDELLLGLRRKHLIVLGAKTGVGKTAFALSLSRSAARAGCPVFFCSYEMGADELGLRMLAAESRVAAIRIETGNLEPADLARLARGSNDLGSAPITFTDAPPTTIPALRAECLALRRQNKLGLLVVDYLQLMEGAGKSYSREREVAEISRGLKKLAMDLDVCVLALSQLNRANDRFDEPGLSDLRDSGAIEQDANTVLFLWAEADDSPVVKLRVAKNRGGQLGYCEMQFKRPIVRFEL